jgi:hypothetical protein
MSVDGGPAADMRYVVRTDPFAVEARERLGETADFVEPTASAHIWELELPDSLAPGIHSVVVETVDEFGQPQRGVLTFEIVPEG